MKTISLCVFLSSVTTLASLGSEHDTETTRTDAWHHWRGPLANGTAPDANPPVTWNEQTNIQWKRPIAGRGSSTPIVWGNRIFILTAIKTDRIDPDLAKPEDQPKRPFGILFPNSTYKFKVFCFDRASGKELWSKTAKEAIPHQGHHGDNSFASASPTTDGERVYAWFGSQGIFCYDMDGKPLWQRDLGQVDTRKSFGEASSPVVHDGRLILIRDNEGQSYIIVMDARTGRTLWRKDRNEPSAWATPLVVEYEGKTHVITNASNRVRSYDLDSGELLWQCGGQVGNVTPSPVQLGDLVFCMSGYRGNALFAIPLSSKADITGGDNVAWRRNRATPYVPSPLIHDGLLYFNQSNTGILSCLVAETGETVIEPTRTELRGVYASPIAASGRIYYVGRGGTTLILKHGKYEVIAKNKLEGNFDASPAAVGKQLLLRSRTHLYCIATDE